MEDVDYPRAWLRFKSYIAEKRGHGQDDLLAEMSRIEVESSVAHRDSEIARPGEGSTSTRKDGPPSPPAATAAGGDEPRTTNPLPPEEARHDERRDRNGHTPERAPEPAGRH